MYMIVLACVCKDYKHKFQNVYKYQKSTKDGKKKCLPFQ
jgi:hypothetical protein